MANQFAWDGVVLKGRIVHSAPEYVGLPTGPAGTEPLARGIRNLWNVVSDKWRMWGLYVHQPCISSSLALKVCVIPPITSPGLDQIEYPLMQFRQYDAGGSCISFAMSPALHAIHVAAGSRLEFAVVDTSSPPTQSGPRADSQPRCRNCESWPDNRTVVIE